MNKKLLAVAVAGALAAPAIAFAQSSVTISGIVRATFGSFKAGNFNPNNVRGANAGNSSETIVKDESSRILFQMREDLGGGLAGIAKFDLRATTDVGTVSNGGESYVGLTSTNWGTVTMGRHDLHYANHASFSGTHLGLQTNPTAVFDRANAGATAIANQTRTANVIRYGSPKFANMFEIVVAYSTNSPTATNEADFGAAARKGSAVTLNPKVWGANWEAGYSYWSDKPDAAAASLKHRGDSLYGWYKWSGLRVGLAWNKSKINTSAGNTSNRTTWGIPVSYQWGSHNIYFDWYKARSDKAAAFSGVDTKANFLNLGYGYDLSKRTAAAVSYTRINNGTGARYGFFTQQQAIVAGEDPRFIGVTLTHRY